MAVESRNQLGHCMLPLRCPARLPRCGTPRSRSVYVPIDLSYEALIVLRGVQVVDDGGVIDRHDQEPVPVAPQHCRGAVAGRLLARLKLGKER